MPDVTVVHNEGASRFEAQVDGRTAVLEYRRRPGAMLLLHTGVPKESEGHGVASKLTRAGLEFARAEGLKVVPLCPFATAYLRRHPEYRELVAEEYRARFTPQ